MKLNQIVIMRSKPNTLETFKLLTMLGGQLHNETGSYFNVIIDNDAEEIKLVKVFIDGEEEEDEEENY